MRDMTTSFWTRMQDNINDRNEYRRLLERVTTALDDAIKCACNGGFPGNGWEQGAYDEWDAARTAAEEALGQ